MVWDEVGDGCFRRRYRSFDLNIGVVRGSEALLVVDTRADRREADELLGDLRVFGRPVQWVVNTHWHFDHTFGNERFVLRSREPVGVDAAEVSAALELWGHAELPAMLLEDEADLRARLRSVYGDEAGDEYDRVVLTPPDRLVTGRQVLDLGDRAVELWHPGRGHTCTDLVLVVPGSGVVFAGDLLEESAPPAYGADSYPLAWPLTAAAVVSTAASTFVPGHGDLMSASDAADQAAAIAEVATIIRRLHEAGVPVDDALAEGGDWWPFPSDSLTEAVRQGYASLAHGLADGDGGV